MNYNILQQNKVGLIHCKQIYLFSPLFRSQFYENTQNHTKKGDGESL